MNTKCIFFVSKLCVYLLLLLLLATAASATTYTISAGSGTLSYTAVTKDLDCVYLGRTIPYFEVAYSNFSYTQSGTANPLTGTVTSTISVQEGSCPAPSYPTILLTATNLEVVFTPVEATGGTATVYLGTAGWVNPKYKILAVMYAPPGSKSTVTYANNSVVGTSTGVTDSFLTSIENSISSTIGVTIFGFTGKVTSTSSDTDTQEESSSDTIAVSQTTSSSTSLSGYSDPNNGINHDYDTIFVWLNPLATFTYWSGSNGTNKMVWGGFGYDLNDTSSYPAMDELGVQLGCLNGDFYQQYVAGTNTNWATCEAIFNYNNADGRDDGFWRGWALNNVDGSIPALTPTLGNSSAPYDFCGTTYEGTDLYNICQVDPFSNASYKVTFPPSGGDTTTDGRFTACSNASSGCATIEYEPDVNKTYSQGYSTTITASETDKDTYSQSFSIESQFSIDDKWGTNFSATFSESLTTKNTYTWSDQFSYSTNSSNGQTASFSIVGPAEGYTGPPSFVVYQDNLYGTFMFYPD